MAKAIAAVVGVLAIVAGAAALNGWALMVLIGILHGLGVLPGTLGFWPSVGVALLLSLIFGGVKRS